MSDRRRTGVNDDLQKLYDQIDDIEIAMMTTRRADGHLVSRPMATQKRAAGADLWFVTCEGTPKTREIAGDPHVNLSYYKDRTSEWVSVSGTATLSRDHGTIKALWAPDWAMYFPQEGDPRHGTADDPRMVLIGVRVHAAQFLEVNKPQAVVLFEMVKGWLTGTEPKLGEMHHVE
jgi:general stress protein 26